LHTSVGGEAGVHGGRHALAAHTSPASQALPHVPQCAVSLVVSAHAAPHRSRPAPHRMAQEPAAHSSLAEHISPQVPQWRGSALVSTQSAPQRVRPAGHGTPASSPVRHVRSMHDWPAGQSRDDVQVEGEPPHPTSATTTKPSEGRATRDRGYTAATSVCDARAVTSLARLSALRPRARAAAALAASAIACGSPPPEPRPEPAPPVVPVAPPEPQRPVAIRTPRAAGEPVEVPAPPPAQGRLVEEARVWSDSASSSFGVSIAFDGRRLVVGDSSADANAGRVTLFERDVGDRWREVAHVVGDAGGERFFGHDVALAGPLVVVCSNGVLPEDSSELRILRADGDALSLVHAFASPTHALRCGRVAASVDRIVADAEGDRGRGALFVLERQPDGIWRPGTSISAPPEVQPYLGFGHSVALAPGGGIVAAAHAIELGHDRSGVVFAIEGGVARAAREGPTTRPAHLFGSELALEGQDLAVADDELVHVYRGREIARTLEAEMVQHLAPTDERPSTFGSSLAMRDGLLVVGDAAQGAAYVYLRGEAGWALLERLDVPGTGVGQVGLGIGEGRIAIGMPLHGPTPDRGSVVIHRVERAAPP
jgi:hypothetical protein